MWRHAITKQQLQFTCSPQTVQFKFYMWILSWLTTVSFHLQSTNWILHVDIILTDNSYSLNSTCGYYLDWQQYPFTCSSQNNSYSLPAVHKLYSLNSTCGYYLDWQQYPFTCSLQTEFYMWILSWLTIVTVWILHVDIILTDNSIHSPAVYKLNSTCGYYLDWQQ